jgi:methylenetetrahydrofolate reductase (NADPH)
MVVGLANPVSCTFQGFENLASRISRLSALNPLAISVTWGAGGSTKDRSLELAGLSQSNGLNTILHLTCTNMKMGLIDEVLKVRSLILKSFRSPKTTRSVS